MPPPPLHAPCLFVIVQQRPPPLRPCLRWSRRSSRFRLHGARRARRKATVRRTHTPPASISTQRNDVSIVLHPYAWGAARIRLPCISFRYGSGNGCSCFSPNAFPPPLPPTSYLVSLPRLAKAGRVYLLLHPLKLLFVLLRCCRGGWSQRPRRPPCVHPYRWGHQVHLPALCRVQWSLRQRAQQWYACARQRTHKGALPLGCPFVLWVGWLG